MSMSETGRQKAGELVPAPSATGPASPADDLFSGLGLGGFVKEKDYAGSIAASLLTNSGTSDQQQQLAPSMPSKGQQLSLEDKRRVLQEAEALKRMKQQGQQPQPQSLPLAPTVRGTAPAQAHAKDLTQTLMERNLSQMGSPGFSAPPTMQQQQQGGIGQSWGAFASHGLSPTPMQQQVKPDLSAFDSLLSMPSSNKSKTPMGSMTFPGTNATLTTIPQQQKHAAKTLTPTDINDLLS